MHAMARCSLYVASIKLDATYHQLNSTSFRQKKKKKKNQARRYWADKLISLHSITHTHDNYLRTSSTIRTTSVAQVAI
jgi:hypothetical protein